MAEKNKKISTHSPKTTKRPSKIEAKAPAEPLIKERGLPIVGVGASAGGLDALRAFFSALPQDPGMAFVVVTHLHPEHESHMAEQLQRHTSMPTKQVVQKIKVEPNHVYVIPPNHNILLTNSHLETVEYQVPHERRTPIDDFFRSVAKSGHSDPIAIVLSGGGTDGSVGVKSIKEAGGLILVQQPEDAEFDSMPRATIGTGLVDAILPAAQLAEKLVDYIQHRPKLPHDPGQLAEAEVETLQRILAQVHARTGHDFSQYKRSTILRRVERRMQLNGFLTLDAYLAYLRGNSTEAIAMFNDILIGVTNFFRDRESWEVLQQKVIPELFRMNSMESAEEGGFRVWSIGCATGEEAYGLAILISEEAAKQEFRTHVQIFASDLDERSISYARNGLYPAAIEADVSPERLEHFFIREGEYYRVKRELRDMVLFTNHNMMRDPPFAKQNLITCRNVLIYLQRPIQDWVFDIFHYSLRPGGYLFLGSSETAEHLPDLFTIVDKNHRIYQAKPWTGERPYIPSMPLALRRSPRVPETSAQSPMGRYVEEPVILEEQHKRALETYGPPSIIVNERNQILHVSETAGRYLHQPKGPITGDLLALVRPELQMELRTALFHAFENGRVTASHPIAVQFNGHARRVVVSVRPRPDRPGMEKAAEKQALVIFIEDEQDNKDHPLMEIGAHLFPGEPHLRITQLESEVLRLREQLQITIEEYDSSNEEMMAASEELQSINEEYRSATEELETSKEELQSVNEELQTLNSEMRNKLDEISRAHRELENLLGATDIATLYIDREMRIQRYTAGVQELFNILSVDRGRRISDLTHHMEYNHFLEDAEQVLRHLIPVEREVRQADGRMFLMRLSPYRTMEDRIEGVVITFIDINQLKAAEQELVRAKESLEERVQERTRELDEASKKLRQARDMFYSLFNANPIPTCLINLEDSVFLNVNVAFLTYFNVQLEEVGHYNAKEFDFGFDLAGIARQNLITQAKRDGKVRCYETEIRLRSGETRNILGSIQYIKLDEHEALIVNLVDITDRVRAEREIRSLAADLTIAEQKERHRISQILHDDLQQRIFAVKIQLAAVSDTLQKADPESIQADLSQLQSSLDESIAITRNLSIDLSPAILQGDSLVDALNWLSSQMQDQYGITVSVDANGVSTRFEDSLRILLFQAVREALFNVVKHADTKSASVQFEESDSLIRLTVDDDGTGFDLDTPPKEKNGLGGLMKLRHRLSLVGCKVEIQSQPGEGTQVIINIPARNVR